MSYGMHPEPVHDPYVELSERITCKLAQAIAPSAFTAGISPVLNYVPEFLPGGGWKKRAKKLKEEMLVLKDAPFDAGMKELVSCGSDDYQTPKLTYLLSRQGLGTAAPSLLSCSLQNMEDDRMDKIETIKEVCGQTFMGNARAARPSKVMTLTVFIQSWHGCHDISNHDIHSRNVVVSRRSAGGTSGGRPCCSRKVANTCRSNPYAIYHCCCEGNLEVKFASLIHHHWY